MSIEEGIKSGIQERMENSVKHDTCFYSVRVPVRLAIDAVAPELERLGALVQAQAELIEHHNNWITELSKKVRDLKQSARSNHHVCDCSNAFTGGCGEPPRRR